MSDPKSARQTAKMTAKGAGRSTLGRRAELAALTALFIFANAVTALLVVRLGDRYSARLDVTATLEHRLAENTRRALDRVTGASAGEVEIVIAAPLSDLDPRARVALGDVLDEIQRLAGGGGAGGGGGEVRVTRIDTGSGEGLAEFESLVQRLRDRDRQALEEYASAVESAMAQLEQLAAYFENDFAPAYTAIAESLEGAGAGLAPYRQHFEANASGARTQAFRLRDQLSAAGSVLEEGSGALLPEIDRAGALVADALSALAPALAQMAQTGRTAARQPGFPAPDQARAVAGQLDQLAAASAEAADRISRQPTPDIIRVARAIQGARAALVIGPPQLGVAAIDFEALLPPAPVIDSAGAGPSALRQRAEELLSTTLLSLAEPVKPIVVFVHGEAQPLLNTGIFRFVRDRLGLRGIDTLEWATVLEEAQPDVGALDPAGVRPVVYVVHNTDTLVSGRGPDGATYTGPDRALRLGAAISRIVRAGEPLLLSLQRSTLPTFGDDDPTAGVLSEFGLKALTGRPLLLEGPPGARRTVETEHMLRASAAEEQDALAGALVRAVEGLPTILSWPIPLEQAEPPQGALIQRRTLYRIDSDRAWGEADWVGFARIPAEQRALVPNAPAPDSPRDDADGPWDVAVAVERGVAGSQPQRLVAVGSSGWFISQIVGAATEVDGRRMPLFPGNGELFEAAVLWLAGQDHLIARTPAAGQAPAVGLIGETEMRWLRWGLIAGLPLGILALGGVARLLRR